MIVISGALVLVALGLLIAGLVVSGGLALVYASIGVSLLSAAFLGLGVRQRRGELAVTAASPAAEDSVVVRAPAAEQPAAEQPVTEQPSPPAPPAEAETVAVTPVVADEEVAPEPVPAAPVTTDAEVYVVPGRPRYHAEGCRFLAGREVEGRTRAEARDEGFEPCGVCKPDAAAAPAAEPAPAAPAARAPRSSPRADGVVVLPDRDKFHKASCRFVRDVPGAQQLTKAGARRQGYQPCGVCKP